MQCPQKCASNLKSESFHHIDAIKNIFPVFTFVITCTQDMVWLSPSDLKSFSSRLTETWEFSIKPHVFMPLCHRILRMKLLLRLKEKLIWFWKSQVKVTVASCGPCLNSIKAQLRSHQSHSQLTLISRPWSLGVKGQCHRNLKSCDHNPSSEVSF